jgi:hypothetical protein
MGEIKDQRVLLQECRIRHGSDMGKENKSPPPRISFGIVNTERLDKYRWKKTQREEGQRVRKYLAGKSKRNKVATISNLTKNPNSSSQSRKREPLFSLNQVRRLWSTQPASFSSAAPFRTPPRQSLWSKSAEMSWRYRQNLESPNFRCQHWMLV